MKHNIAKNKLFNAYVAHVHGDLYRFHFNKKIIFYKGFDHGNPDEWVLYYDLEEKGVFVIAEQKFYPIDVLMEKINKLKEVKK